MDTINTPRFHTNPNTGDSNPCGARIKCKFKLAEDEHYATQAEAEQAYQKSQKANLFPVIESQEKKPDTTSAQVSHDYARWSILHDHLHNSNSFDHLPISEIAYYATAVGAEELEWRKRGEKDGTGRFHDVDAYICDAFEAKDFTLTDEENMAFEKLLADSANVVARKSDPNYEIDTNAARRNPALQAYLVNQSNTWLSTLTTEEQANLARCTSNGFYWIEQSRMKENRISRTNQTQFAQEVDPEVMKAIEDKYPDEWSISDEQYSQKEQEITKIYGEIAKKKTEMLRQSVAKAPRLDTAIKTYRGLNIHELDTVLGTTDAEKIKNAEKLLNGDFNNMTLSREESPGKASKLAHAPISSSLNEARALSFSKALNRPRDDDNTASEPKNIRFIYEIEAKTMASPVNVSAWSSGEAEIYTNHNSDYQITGAYTKPYSKRSDLIIIKLKEILND